MKTQNLKNQMKTVNEKGLVKSFVIIFSMVLFLSSCTKVVIIELGDSDEKLVVEGLISDANEPFKVKLTMLAPYFSNGNPPVADAEVYINDDAGNWDTLTYSGNGYYSTSGNRQVVGGRTYTLTVLHNGITYNASSTVPDYKMNLDSITYVYNEGSSFIPEGYNIILNAQENPVEGDFVRFLFWRNDTLQTDPFKYFISDDIYVNGNYIVAQVPYNYKSGDTARAEIQSIDRGYYRYLYTLSLQVQNTGGPFDSAPANPPTNLNNGALGYFAACYRDWKEIVLP